MHLRLSQFTALLLVLNLSFSPCRGYAAPIYVIREKGGVVRFSSKPPAAGVTAEVFTARGARFSVMGGRSSYNGGRLFTTQYHETISEAAKQQGIDESLVKAVIHVESAFNPRAVSPKGAQGLMQLMPPTAQYHGVKHPFDPQENIVGGTRHLASLLRRYNGNVRLALAAYNAGEEAVRQYGGVPPFDETQKYVERVLHMKLRYRTAQLNFPAKQALAQDNAIKR